jgi:hypothetical protein
VNILHHCQRINPSFPRCTEASKHHLLLYRSDSVAVLADGGTVQGAACLFVVPVLFVTFSRITHSKGELEELKHKAQKLKADTPYLE